MCSLSFRAVVHALDFYFIHRAATNQMHAYQNDLRRVTMIIHTCICVCLSCTNIMGPGDTRNVPYVSSALMCCVCGGSTTSSSSSSFWELVDWTLDSRDIQL